MRRQLASGLLMTMCLVVLLGLAYPLAVLGVGRAAFPHQADGSLVTDRAGRVVGSSLIGQPFTTAAGDPDPRYFQPRPSAAGSGYDGLSSGGSNLGPSNPALVAPASGPHCYLVDKTDAAGHPVAGPAGTVQVCSDQTVPARAAAYRALNHLAPTALVPVDAVTASGSGLDPQISVANARLQAARVAAARHLPLSRVLAAVSRHTEGRKLGVLGERVVNVLELNLDLDR